jgi:hypothetical protein
MPAGLPAGSISIGDDVTSAVMQAGNGMVSDGFGGTFNNSPFLACTWSIRNMRGSGPNTTDFLYTGVIKLPHALPSVIVRPKVGALSEVNLLFNNLQNVEIVQLEGDFSNYFEVFSSNSNPANAFEFLPPNIMAKLIDSYGNACFELAGEYLYLFIPTKPIDSGLVIEPVFDPAIQDAFLEKLSALANLYAAMNQSNTAVDSTEVITHDPGLQIHLGL